MKISCLSTLFLALTVCSVGCAGLGDAKLRGPNVLTKMFSEEELEFETPSSMVAIWKPSTFEKPGSKSIRGFGGRFYFHNAKMEPVKVDGALTIYGYDDADGDTSGKADRKFVFEAKTLQQHHSETGIGHSYSFWIPWDEVGGLEKTITLIPVFKSFDGEIPQAKPATLRLPGRKAAVVATAEDSLYGPGTQVISASGVVSNKPMVQQAVAMAEIKDAAGGRDSGAAVGRRSTTTFKLPPNLADRIARAKPGAEVRSKPKAGELNTEAAQTLHQGDAPIYQANSIGSAVDASAASVGASAGLSITNAREERPVFGQPGSF